MLLRSLTTAAALSVAAIGNASASVVFEDQFNYGSALGLNADNSVFGGIWETTDGTVDYLAGPPAAYNELCRSTAGCVDLDGSTGNAGVFSTVRAFEGGTYELSVQLFGNGRGGSDTVTISLGTWSRTLVIGSGDDASQTFSFTTSGGVLRFDNSGGDNVGAILSSVSLAAVPVPAGGLLLMGALGGLAMLRRRKPV